MLTCQELTELVTDYLEGHQSLIERLRFEVHLGMCRHCRAYLRQMKHTVHTLGRLSEDEIPADVSERLMARFRDWRS